MDFSSATMDPDGREFNGKEFNGNVSGERDSNAKELLNLLVSLTGLPEDSLISEIEHLMGKIGKNAQDMNMENLREALLLHLDSLHAEFGSPTD